MRDRRPERPDPDRMTNPHIYLDVDDVLAETTRALAELARARFGRRVAFDDMAHFDLRISLGLDAREHVRFMEAAHEESFLSELPPMPGAIETVSGWHRAGARISVVTGRPPDSRGATERWLARTGLPYHRLEHVDKYDRYGTSEATRKEDLARRDYAIVVEDSADMAAFFVARTAAVVLLVDRPWNRRSPIADPRIRRVDDWSDIARACADIAPGIGDATG